MSLNQTNEHEKRPTYDPDRTVGHDQDDLFRRRERSSWNNEPVPTRNRTN